MTEFDLQRSFENEIDKLNDQKSEIDNQIVILKQREKHRRDTLENYYQQRREDDNKIDYPLVKLVINGCVTYEFQHQFDVEPTIQKYKPMGNGICQLFNRDDPTIVHQLSLSIAGETIVRDFNLSSVENNSHPIYRHIPISINFNRRWFLYCFYFKDTKKMQFITIKNEFNPHNIH